MLALRRDEFLGTAALHITPTIWFCGFTTKPKGLTTPSNCHWTHSGPQRRQRKPSRIPAGSRRPFDQRTVGLPQGTVGAPLLEMTYQGNDPGGPAIAGSVLPSPS